MTISLHPYATKLSNGHVALAAESPRTLYLYEVSGIGATLTFRKNDLLWFDGMPTSVRFEKPAPKKPVGRILADPSEESAKWPLNISDEQYEGLSCEGQDRYKTLFSEEEGPPVVIEVSTEGIFILESTGSTPGVETIPEGLEWVPDEAYCHLLSSGARHLVPGKLVGLRDVAVKRLDRRPQVTLAKIERFNVKFYVNRAYSDERTEEYHPYTRQGTKSKKTAFRPLVCSEIVEATLPIHEVVGTSLADALEKAERAISEWVEEWAPRPGHVCPTCDGFGVTFT